VIKQQGNMEKKGSITLYHQSLQMIAFSCYYIQVKKIFKFDPMPKFKKV